MHAHTETHSVTCTHINDFVVSYHTSYNSFGMYVFYILCNAGSTSRLTPAQTPGLSCSPARVFSYYKMSLPDLNSSPNLASRNLAVARWIHLVSQHPPWYVPQMAAPEPDSDNELQPIPPPVRSLGDGLHARAAKRVRSDSDLRPQVGTLVMFNVLILF